MPSTIHEIKDVKKWVNTTKHYLNVQQTIKLLELRIKLLTHLQQKNQ